MKKVLALCALIPVLTGCVAAVPAALVVGATAGGAVVYDKRDFKTMRNDQRSASLAQYWISQDPELQKSSHITVTVYNGVGLMVGQTQTAELRDKAYELMRRVPSIKRIYNAVAIAAPSSKMQRASDSMLTGKVRTALLAERGLQSNNIKAVTEDSVVYLMGSVPKDQAELATNATRHVSGVQRVVKVFEYS